jgi:hypothetical protein
LETVSMKQINHNSERRRALAVLAESPDGCARAVMLARGFPLALLNYLVRAGFATSYLERGERGDKLMEMMRVKITEAGRRTLAIREAGG